MTAPDGRQHADSDEARRIAAGYQAVLKAGEGTVVVGRTVLCDVCSTDLTDDPRSGGYMFGSYAYGPCCASERLATIQGYGEEWNIRAWCPPELSFADWIRAIRGPNAVIRVTPGMPRRGQS